MENVSNKEIDIIIEALSMWEERCSSSDLDPSAVGPFEMDSPNMAQAVINKLQEIKRLHEKAHTDRRELSTLLKAKLIGIKQSRAIEAATTPRCGFCGGPHYNDACPDLPPSTGTKP